MYELRPPAAPLSRFIEHYWFVESRPASPMALRVDVFVDGRADLIFNFGAPYVREQLGRGRAEHARSNLDAQRLYPIRIIQSGEVRTTGVRFRLAGLAPFTSTPLRRLTGRTVPPAEAFGDGARALEDSLRVAETLEAQTTLLDRFFLERLSLDPSFERLDRALRLSIDSSGGAPVTALAEAARVTVRHLDRLFARYLGLTPRR